MKKNRFQQQKEEQKKQNYFDEEEDIDLEDDGLFGKEVLIASKPYEEYFQKFNQLYNNHIVKFSAFEEDYQIPLTSPDYENIIQSHFMVYEKNMGLFDFMKSDNKVFDKISASFVFIDNQIRQIEDQFYKFLDKLTIYGELADLHLEEERKLVDGEAEIMICRMLGQFKQIYDIIKKLINYITHLVNQLNLLYNKKDPISKIMKIFNLNFPLDTIGRALQLIYVLDNVVEQNDYLQEHWNFCKRMIKIVKPDPTKFNSNAQNVKQLEKIMIRLDKTVLSGNCLQSVLAQNWDQNVHEKTGKEKNANIPAIKNNKDFFNLLNTYLKERYELFDKTLGTAKEMFERDLLLPTFCVYALVRQLYPNDENRDLWKNLWSLQKKIPMVDGHSQVLCYLSKFLMEVTPLTKKSQSMDPKDPIANFKNYLQRLSASFQSALTAQYVAFTTWIVRVDSFSCSQASFNNIDKIDRERAQRFIEERMNQRVVLVLQGLTIASQTRNLLQSLLLGNFGLEEQSLDMSLSKDVVLAVEMLKAIEYYFEQKYDVFQPALIQNHITKNGQKIIQQVLEKMKANLKSFGTGGAEILGALQILNSILKSTLSPLKLQTMYFLMDFMVAKDIFTNQEKEDFRNILWRLDKLILLPYYVKKVTASTYFYWCRELLPSFFQYIYQNPSQAKRFQFLLNAVSDCSIQLKDCMHLENPDELFDSFRQFVVKEFYTQYLQPLARDIEDYLRIQVHTVLIEKITALNPFKQQVKDLKRLLDIDYVLIFDSIVNLRTEINQILNETFYNINVLNMYDQETYEQMRSLANSKFGLNLINVYLPTQTVDQGNFDVLNVLKSIQQFFTKYTYNLYQQQFVQVTSESKQVYSISIQQIADSIRTHGIGILSTTVNSVYKFLQKKIQMFSQFLFDDLIQSPLVREDRFFREKKDELDGQYPIERAEALYKEIKKMGTFDDGSNYLDKFRTLITQIGNALAFVRLLRSAALHVNSKCLEYIPSQYNSTQLESLTREAGFSDATVSTAKELEEIFTQYKSSFSEKIDYINLLLNAFSSIKSPENEHLSLFYLIVPTLTLNFIEKMLISKDQIGKKNSTTEVFISDDGFTLGIQFFLTLLDQKAQFDSLHWRKEIKSKFTVDMKQAKTLATTKPNQSQRATDEINMQKELSLRKLNMQYDEFQMFFYAFNSCKILFLGE
ncbi:unnamed protein product [Paramecium sonneborni]|uniref:Uncharacterized protein n=1 Tax=Paramecium sonneborni TaxID=65129 RepID=A0A8S1RN20_9CILI|nr:unnamed protein product [Paramecium sonneborni]